MANSKVSLVTASSVEWTPEGGLIWQGTEGADERWGTHNADVLKGMGGNDTLNAYFGVGDQLFGGNGDDYLNLFFASGAKMYGGAGNDTYHLNTYSSDSADSVVEYSNSGTDTLEIRVGSDVDLMRANFYAIENLTLLTDIAGEARVVNGNGLANTILTSSANDSVFGGAGADEIRTGDGADWLDGGLANDTLDGGNGADQLYGGLGDDSLWAGAGDDRLYGGDGNEVMDAGLGADLAYGGAGNDSIMGRGGNDLVFGDAGNDTVNGDGENDRVWGGDGNDIVYGGSGDDTVSGDAGMDLVYGGAGIDRFVFRTLADAPASGLDRVMDFQTGEKMDLSLIDADSTLAGNQAFHFNATKPFFASAGDLNVSTNLLGTLVEGDVNGDGVADFRLLVVGTSALQATDFIL